MVLICHMGVRALGLGELVYREYQYSVRSVHRRRVFVIHGSETALKIAEWGRARRFYKFRVGVGNGAVLDFKNQKAAVFVFTRVFISLRTIY
jgi:hypothetical protein